MDEEAGKAKGKIKYILLSVIVVLVSVLYAVLYFRGVAERMWQSMKDLGLSAAYYVTELFLGEWLSGTITPTVQNIPSGVTQVLPGEYAGFKEKLIEFGKLLIAKENLQGFFGGIAGMLKPLLQILILLIIPVLCIVLLKLMRQPKIDNNHGGMTKPFRAWMKIEDKVIFPVINFFKGYIGWLNEHRKIVLLLGLIWAYNLNALTILTEAFAYLFYFSAAGGDLKIYTQIAKLAIDLTPALTFLPKFVWVIVAYLVFNHIRRKIGYEILDETEARNQDFLENHPGNLVIEGKPRVGKTQANADMNLSQNIIFREKAHEKMFERRMEFPFFKWDVLEQTLKNFRKNIGNFNLPKLRGFVAKMREHYEGRAIITPEEQEKFLKSVQKLGYIGNDFIFDYDVLRYPMEYDDNLRIVGIWDTIKKYAEEYYIYTCPTPLNIGNFSMREDIEWIDYGNHPLLVWDFFRSRPRDSFARSQYSHNLIFDALRLGKKIDPEEPYQNALEIGCIGITEAGKEFGNQNTNQGLEAKAKTANVKNDLLTTDMKMHSHGATIDYYTYFRIIMDEQRAASIMADITELGQVITLRSKSKPKIVMPGFAIEEGLYLWATEKYREYSETYMNRHGGMSLRIYLLTRLYVPIYNHYTRIFNTFSQYRLKVRIKDCSAGQTDSEGEEDIYYINTKKTCSDRYDTTSFGAYYDEKWRHSEAGGISQMPQFSTIRPTIDELRRQGSYNVRRLDRMFYGIEQEEEIEEKAPPKRKRKQDKRAGQG